MYLLFDIGGTKMRLAVSEDGEIFGEPRIVPTPENFDKGMTIFAQAVKELSGGKKIDAVAGGIAGPLNREKTMLVNSPNIGGWIGKPLKEKLEEAIGVPVILENDTALVGLGEAVAGSGKGYGITAYIGVGTGIGGVRIVDGCIDRNTFGFEIGHHIISCPEIAEKSRDMDMCTSCSVPGHLEGYVSGSAMSRREGKKPYEITDRTIWEEAARCLAYGLNNVAVFWSPEVIILGGSMIVGEPAIPIDRVRHYFEAALRIFPEKPEIKKAALKDVGGLHGALALLKQHKT